jgi:uncharacterized membrane protein YGL010W
MNLKKLRNLCYLLAGLGIIIVPLIVTFTGHYLDELGSHLILTILFIIVETGLVLNLVSNKKMNAPKTTIRKNFLMCLVNGYVIL